MKKIRANFLNLIPGKKVLFGQNVINKLTGNANFPVTNPTLANVQAVQDGFSTAVSAASDGSKLAIAARNDREAEWDDTFDRLATNITDLSGGDETKILSSGFEPVKDKSASVLPETPQNVRLSNQDLSGSIRVSWDKSSGALSYIVSKALGNPDGSLPPDATYDSGLVVTQVRTVVEGLTRGSYYAFRVRAVGAQGQTPWSDVAAGFCN